MNPLVVKPPKRGAFGRIETVEGGPSRRGGTSLSPSAWMEGAAWRQGSQLFPAFVFVPRDEGDDGNGGGRDGGMRENRYWDVKDFDGTAEPQL